MGNVVYILCAATCLLCTIMLAKGYRRTGARLLLWSCLCFLFLSLNNLLLVIDETIFPQMSLTIGPVPFFVIRNTAALIGLLLLVVGFVWDSK